MSMGKFTPWTTGIGWQVAERGAALSGPHGARASLHPGGGGLPNHELLVIEGEVDGNAYMFAVTSEIADSYAYDLGTVTHLALHVPRAVADGAVLPWVDRMRAVAAVWVRDEEGTWLAMGGGTGRAKVPAPDTAAKRRIQAVLAPLAQVSAPEAAAARAARAAELLAAAGWKAGTKRAARSRAGTLALAHASFESADGAKHRVEYVVTGWPIVPEGLLWRYTVPTTPGAPTVERIRLVDLTGALDPEIPEAAFGESADVDGALVAAVASVVRAGAPAANVGSNVRVTAELALTALASVLDIGGGSKFERRLVGYRQHPGAGFPKPVPVKLSEAVSAVRAAPTDAEAWVALAESLVEKENCGAAARAYAKAADLGTGDGWPLLRRAWLRRALDPEAAVTELDRAAEAGGCVGQARHLQAHIVRRYLGDQERMDAVFARMTEEAPEYVEGWLSWGLYLAKDGQAEKAVDLLTRALELHRESKVFYYLGYAWLVAGRREAALDSLEEAVRLAPWTVGEIVGDEDLSALRGDERFESLEKLAAGADEARHRDAREALRPQNPPAPDGDSLARATDLATVTTVLGIHCLKVYDADVPHEGLRRFLAGTGIPYSAGAFKSASIRGRSRDGLRRYTLDEYLHRIEGDHIPSGLGGLVIVGELDRGAEVGVDGETGDVYRIARDFRLTWLAPSLDAFLRPYCLPKDTWVWRVTAGHIDRLTAPDVAHIGPGRLVLVADGLGKDELTHLFAFVRNHGELLDQLRIIDSWQGKAGELGDIDLAEACPNLRALHVTGGAVNGSVFAHPALHTLNLSICKYAGPTREIRLDTGSLLKTISLEDCAFEADTLYVGPGSPLQSFSATIDEDYGFTFPENLEFDNCPDLSGIYLSLDAGVWHLVLRGSLPRLRRVDQNARPYGSFTYKVLGATPAETKQYTTLVKKGARYAKAW
ncbi:TPR end-of-group domain-containing protein [Yinghuangia sp. YIM S09857]|uniref:TPR end-of-group domain-containing protein n=1 Tax=Yinghuangia sp. YIM S09857 TaxID=3436929 RepID=UPI003F5306BA